MANFLELDGTKVGDDYNTYFIAEAGLNHNGNLKLAKKLIEEANNAGANAIKFQTYKSENFLSQSSEYFKFFKSVELSYNEFFELKNYAQEIGITFFSSPFDIESAENLIKIGVPFFKVASSDITNMPLIKFLAKTNLPLIISTGISDLSEIEEAIKWCNSEGNNKIVLLHCVANYPTQPTEANIMAINTMKQKLDYPIGYSDNGESTLVDLVAVSLGANIIEKHFTLDKKMEGPDHSFSIDPIGLKKLISEIKLIKEIKGNGKKIPQQSEISNKNSIRKCITAKKNIQKGEILSVENLSIKRPAEGLEPKFFYEIIGKTVKKNIQKDAPIHKEDIELKLVK